MKVLLSIQAHPDDTDFFAGGTVAKFIENGWTVIYVSVTDGAKGTFDHDIKPETLAKVRMEEQRRAAKVLGVEDTIFLGYEDTTLHPNLELRGELIKIIREVRPSIVMTHDAWKPYEVHPDHRCTGIVATEAATFASLPHVNPEHLEIGLKPHRVEAIYLFDTVNPNTVIDTMDVMEKKIKALSEHRSQQGEVIGKLAKERDSLLGKKIGKHYAEPFMKL